MTGIHGLSAREWEARLAAAGVAPGVREPLGRFLELLGQWARAVDLTARSDAESIVREDVLGALAGVPYLPERGSLLDIGSGSGFPAVPLLVAGTALHGTLLEPRERRWAFLREVVRELKVSAEVRQQMVAEHAGGPYDVVSLRGVRRAPWERLIPRLLAAEGVLLWWSGSGAAEAAGRWPGGSVITSHAVPSGHSHLVVWRRCST